MGAHEMIYMAAKCETTMPTGYTSPSRDESTLSQNLLRHLKCNMTFQQVESMREGLACLRRGLTDAEFHELCDDLARDIVLYGDI